MTPFAFLLSAFLSRAQAQTEHPVCGSHTDCLNPLYSYCNGTNCIESPLQPSYEHKGCFSNYPQPAMDTDHGIVSDEYPGPIEACSASCADFTYFALYQHTHCFCDNSYLDATQYGTSRACWGSGTGGSYSIDLYQQTRNDPIYCAFSTEASCLQSSNLLFQNDIAMNQTSFTRFAFYLANDNVSCGGNISNVQVQNGVRYDGQWLSYTPPLSQHQYYYAFRSASPETPFTLPIAVRVSKGSDNIETFDIVSKLSKNQQIDTGVTFCDNTPHPTRTYTLHPSVEPTSIPSAPPTPFTDPYCRYGAMLDNEHGICGTADCQQHSCTNNTVCKQSGTSCCCDEIRSFGLYCDEHPAPCIIPQKEEDANNAKSPWFSDMTLTGFGAGLLVVILLVFVAVCLYRKMLRKSSEYICNALVCVITIGEYLQSNMVLEEETYDDLPALPLHLDHQHMSEFCGLLNYKMMPRERRLFWSQQEIRNFLQFDIGREMFDENDELKYDALMLVISSHGDEQNIITSDRRYIEKTWIHRILSTEYPKIRQIPRVCMIDACGGRDEKLDIDEHETPGKAQEDAERGKRITLKDDIRPEPQWTNTKSLNPDYKLVEIHAANKGFQAKTNMYLGSYLISTFKEKVERNLVEKQEKSIGEIFEEIQEELHEQGKQQTSNTFNNGTNHLRLRVNTERVEDDNKHIASMHSIEISTPL